MSMAPLNVFNYKIGDVFNSYCIIVCIKDGHSHHETP